MNCFFSGLCRGTATGLLFSGLLVNALSAADRATLWTPEQVIAALSGKDYRAQEMAEGQLYLLPESAFPVLSAVLGRRPDQHPEAWAKRITRALVLRGDPLTVKSFVNTRFFGGSSTTSFGLDDEQVIGQATVEELLPVTREFAVRMAAEKGNVGYQGSELWIRLAGVTGEPLAMRQVLALATSRQGRIAMPNMAGRFDPDRCSEVLLPGMTKGEIADRLGYLRLLRTGWQTGPNRVVAVLMKDQEAQIRGALARTLSQSTSEAALELIVQGLGDTDSFVRGICLNALGNFKGKPQTQLLYRLAIDERVDPSMRQQAWWILTEVPGDLLVMDAKGLVGSSAADRSLRSAAMRYLLKRDGSRWLLDAIPRLEPAMKAEVISTLAQSGSVAVLDEIPNFLRRAEPALVGQVLNALANLKDAKVLPLLISHLKDSRAEVRRSAANALNNATGLSYHPSIPARSDAPGEVDAAAEIRILSGAWSRWYDLFAAPLPAELIDDFAVARAALQKRDWKDDTALTGLSGEAYPVLLRLTGDKSVGAKAITLLGRLGDQRTASALIGLVDGPAYGSRNEEFTRALMSCQADGTAVPQLLKLLARPDTEWLAVRVLVAWRMPSAALTDVILKRGGLPQDLIVELKSWKDCPVISAARKLITDTKAEERQRTQALGLLVQLGDERDVKALSKEVADSGPASYLAVRGLVRMGSEGVEFAAAELARLLQPMARRAPAKPAKPVPGKPVEEPVQKPDPSPSIIAALRDRPRDERSAKVPLAESLVAAVRVWTKSAKTADQQLAGLALLLEAGDAGGVAVLRDLLAVAEPAMVRQAFDTVIDARRPEARSYVDLLLASPGLDDQRVARLTAWYRDVAKLPPADLAKLRAALADRQEGQAGQPVRGLVLSLDLAGTTAPLGAKGLKARVQIKNTGKTPYTCFPEHFSFMVQIKRLGHEQGPLLRSARPDLKSKTLPNGSTQPTVIGPGQSLSLVITFDAPEEYYVAASHRVRLTWDVPRSHGSEDNETKATFTTRWIDYAFIPPLWEAIDRRSAGANR